jgi:hypothetical protein
VAPRHVDASSGSRTLLKQSISGRADHKLRDHFALHGGGMPFLQDFIDTLPTTIPTVVAANDFHGLPNDCLGWRTDSRGATFVKAMTQSLLGDSQPRLVESTNVAKCTCVVKCQNCRERTLRSEQNPP